MFEPDQELVLEPPVVRFGSRPGEPSVEVAARIRQGRRSREIAFRFANAPGVSPDLAMDAMLPLALVPAMKLGSPLRVEGEIDREILLGADRFQEIFSAWYPEFQRVPIEASPVTRKPPPEDTRGAGVFFSGGLDSTYTLRKHQDEATHAIFVHGCDIPLANTDYRERTSVRLRKAAESFGVELVEVETDLLEFSDAYSHWGYHYHGCALAAIGMLLSGSLRKVFIAASDPYVALVPWGSSCVTDPLWSSPSLEVIHDGAEHDRLGKIRAISGDRAALENLRVCFETPPDGFNCGRCEKCYRTMVGLRLFGALERCPVFDEALDLPEMVASKEVQKAAPVIRAWRIMREEAARQGTDGELIAALDELFRLGAYHQLIRDFARSKKDITGSPEWQRTLPKIRTSLWESLRDNDAEWLAGRVSKWLPDIREQAFERLWQYDRRWFKRRYRSARISRLLQRIRGKKRSDGDGDPRGG